MPKQLFSSFEQGRRQPDNSDKLASTYQGQKGSAHSAQFREGSSQPWTAEYDYATSSSQHAEDPGSRDVMTAVPRSKRQDQHASTLTSNSKPKPEQLSNKLLSSGYYPRSNPKGFDAVHGQHDTSITGRPESNLDSIPAQYHVNSKTALTTDMGNLHIHGRASEFEETYNDDSKYPDVFLLVDLNTREPVASFIAPAFGYSRATFLPVLEAMSQAKEDLLKSELGSSKLNQAEVEWTEMFLSHCQKLLQSQLGRALNSLRLHISLTTRSDASERDKHILLKTAAAAGFITKTEGEIHIFPTIEAVAVEAIRNNLHTGPSISSGVSPTPEIQYGDCILVLYFDGDLVEIQSYNLSRPEGGKKFEGKPLRLEETVYGNIVECGRLVDEQFGQWAERAAKKLRFEIPTKALDPNGPLIRDFTQVRRSYKAENYNEYKFLLNRTSYDPPLRIKDSEMQDIFCPAMNSLRLCLDRHIARVRKKNMVIDAIIFAGAKDTSSYVEAHVKDWAVEANILTRDHTSTVSSCHTRFPNTDILAFPQRSPIYIRSEPTPEMISQGGIHGRYQDVETVPRSRAHYGVCLLMPFREDDPAWSRATDKWDDIDNCIVRMDWQVHKDQVLDEHANITVDYDMVFELNSSLSRELELYKSDHESPPRWTRRQETVDDEDVEYVGTMAITFEEEDFQHGEIKLCSDQVVRRLLRFRVRVYCGNGSRTLRVTALSADGERVLGSIVFRFD